MKSHVLVLFDGNALVHRAFHALPPLTVSKTGEMVSAALAKLCRFSFAIRVFVPFQYLR